MIFASKSNLSPDNLKILRPKATKNLTNLPKKFCEFPPRECSLIKNLPKSWTNQITLKFLVYVNNYHI